MYKRLYACASALEARGHNFPQFAAKLSNFCYLHKFFYMFFMENPKIIGLQEGNWVNFNIRNAIVTHAEALLLHAEGLLLQLEALLLHGEPLPEVVKVMPEHIDEKKLFFALNLPILPSSRMNTRLNIGR